jgi:hypothetical protein
MKFNLAINVIFFGLKHLCAFECDWVMAILFKEVGYIKTIDLAVNHSLIGMYLSVQFSFMAFAVCLVKDMELRMVWRSREKSVLQQEKSPM